MNQRYLKNIVLYISNEQVQGDFTGSCPPDVSELIRIKGNFPGALYICDTEETCSTLKSLGFAVCALIHDENRSSSFDGIGFVIEDPALISLDDYEHIYRRLAGLPWDILETERLILRETTMEDLDRIYEIYDDEEVRKFIEPLLDRSEEDAYQRNYIDRIYGFYNIGIWSMIRKGDNVLIGRAGIEYTDKAGMAELGFIVAGSCRRQGYAYEASKAIIEYARTIEDIDVVRARIRKDNLPSKNLCEKLGMAPGAELNDDLVEWLISAK